MNRSNYRIESSDIMAGPLLPNQGTRSIELHDRDLAIAVAAKSVTIPYGREIRVVFVSTGEVIFRKTAATTSGISTD